MKSKENVEQAAKSATDLPVEPVCADKMATAENGADTLAGETAEIPAEPDVKESAAVDNPEPSADDTGAEELPAAAGRPDGWEEELAEAERRGYLRGRNESIEKLMQAPAMYERCGAPAPETAATEEVPFLSRRKVSIWNL